MSMKKHIVTIILVIVGSISLLCFLYYIFMLEDEDKVSGVSNEVPGTSDVKSAYELKIEKEQVIRDEFSLTDLLSAEEDVRKIAYNDLIKEILLQDYKPGSSYRFLSEPEKLVAILGEALQSQDQIIVTLSCHAIFQIARISGMFRAELYPENYQVKSKHKELIIAFDDSDISNTLFELANNNNDLRIQEYARLAIIHQNRNDEKSLKLVTDLLASEKSLKLTRGILQSVLMRVYPAKSVNKLDNLPPKLVSAIYDLLDHSSRSVNNRARQILSYAGSNETIRLLLDKIKTDPSPLIFSRNINILKKYDRNTIKKDQLVYKLGDLINNEDNRKTYISFILWLEHKTK